MRAKCMAITTRRGGVSSRILCEPSSMLFQNLGKSFDGAYTARISIVLVSGSSTVKKSVSLFPWLFVFVILQPLFFFKKTSIPLLVDGFPWIVYLAKS